MSNNFFFSEKNPIFFFPEFFETIQYFFLVVSRPFRRVLKTFSEKNSKKIKIIKFVKKFRKTFFFEKNTRFFFCFPNFSKSVYFFLLTVSHAFRRVLKTFSEKNSKKIKIIKFVKKFRTTFFFPKNIQDFFFVFGIFRNYSIFFPSCFASL